jgi:hypothetical protein
MQQNIYIEHEQTNSLNSLKKFSNKMSKRSLGKKAFTVVRKLGHKSTQALRKLGSKAVNIATSKTANYLVGAAASALL